MASMESLYVTFWLTISVLILVNKQNVNQIMELIEKKDLIT